ncbi:Diacylglycerol kinase 5 [Sarracenia purpurea var. burkii]
MLAMGLFCLLQMDMGLDLRSQRRDGRGRKPQGLRKPENMTREVAEPEGRRKSEQQRRRLGLSQAHRIRFEFHKGALDHTYMRIDGEPWKQPLPVDDDTVVIEISHHGQVKVLATDNCIAKSVHDSAIPTSYDANEEDNSEEDSIGEEWQKFGAADTFNIPHEEGDKGKES